MKLAFFILAHNDTPNLFRLVRRLTADGDIVVVHWDKKNSQNCEELAQQALDAQTLEHVLFSRRVDVGWGKYSMIDATLACVEKLKQSGIEVDYASLLSAADYPIRSLAELKQYLTDNQGKNFIECVDPEVDPWVIQGLVKERYQHYHWISWRDHPRLFSFITDTQGKMGVRRRLPLGMAARFGSQWWTLTWETLSQIHEVSQKRSVPRFFKTTWVPDEMYFQTLANFVAPESIVSTNLTFYHFNDQGKPLVFYNDHAAFLLQQDYFFARKLSPHAVSLRDKLDAATSVNAKGRSILTALGKHMDQHYQFMAVNRHAGLQDRRVVGQQSDDWYGDLEWNRQAYFVVLTDPYIDVTTLRNEINLIAGVECYGKLFKKEHIDYALPGKEHPFYPWNKVALRDQKKPNFISDLIHMDTSVFTGFIVGAVDEDDYIKDLVSYDPRAQLIVLMPKLRSFMSEGAELEWTSSYVCNKMEDYRHVLQKSGKYALIVHYEDNTLPRGEIDRIKNHITQIKLAL